MVDTPAHLAADFSFIESAHILGSLLENMAPGKTPEWAARVVTWALILLSARAGWRLLPLVGLMLLGLGALFKRAYESGEQLSNSGRKLLRRKAAAVLKWCASRLSPEAEKEM